MAAINDWLANVADAKARGDAHAANWLTACWMPYKPSQRDAAKNGAPKVESGPVTPIVSAEPIRVGRIVFRSTVRQGETTTE